MGEAETDGNGEYSQNLTPGTYTVLFRPEDYNGDDDADLVSAWYREPDATSASLVTVVGGETKTGIGAQLEAGGRISGWVGAPGVGSLLGIQVKVYAAGDGSTSVFEATTDASGQYTIRAVASGSYKVYFDPALHNQVMSADYLPEWFHNKPYFGSATILPVGVGDRRNGQCLAHSLLMPERCSWYRRRRGRRGRRVRLETIRWEGRVATGDVKILLYQGMTLKGTISAKTPNDGAFDWTVPVAQAPGSYNLWVVWLSNPTVLAKSATFSVTATTGPIAVAPPAAPVVQGAQKPITWDGIPQTGKVKILLYQGSVLKGTISASAPNNGSFDWIVPALQAPGLYTVRVVWLSKPTVMGESAPFTVVATAGPIMVEPLVEPVSQGSVKFITWGGIPQTGKVKILLYQSGVMKGTISASTSNDGAFPFHFTVSPLQAPGTYTVRVVWLSKPTVMGESAPFAVVATAGPITVDPLVEPPATAVYQGEKKTITWGGIP